MDEINKNVELKMNILKKGIVEERKKNQVLLNENNSLKESLIEKQEIISKLQDDLNNKNNEILKTEPKNYYSTLFGQPSNEQAKIIEEKNKIISDLEEKIQNLKDENDSFQEQTMVLKQNLESLTEDIDKLRTENEKKVQNLEKIISEKNLEFKENQEKVEIIKNLYKDFDSQKFSYDSQIKELQTQNNKKEKEIEELNKQIEALMDTIVQLKKDIEKKSSECLKLKKELENKIEITKDYVFEGKLLLDGDNEVEKKMNKITFFFGKYEEALLITFANNEKVIPIKHINYIKLIPEEKMNNVLSVNFTNDTTDNYTLVCEFLPRECEYILKFYEEMENKNKKKNETIWRYTFDNL